jgi:hypothetical protein
MKIKLLLILTLIGNVALAQFSSKSFAFGKSWSKEVSVDLSKTYIVNEILGPSNTPIKFETDPSAASTSGELTSLVYNCSEKNKTGLLLAFYGTALQGGVSHTGFAFKEIPKAKALEVLKNLVSVIEANQKYFREDWNNHNVYFMSGDMTFIIYTVNNGINKEALDKARKIRVLWSGFDSEWDAAALVKTIKALEKS